MLDWLRRSKDAPPSITIAGQDVPVVIRRLPQSKRLTLRLAPDGSEVRISMPRWARTEEGLAFARSREAWLAAQMARFSTPAPLAHGSALPFRGLDHPIAHDPTAPRRITLADGQLLVGGPAESLSARLQRWLQAQAREACAQDLAFYCARAAVPVPALALSGAQARWGSCSARGVVRLNWRLMMAPDAVRRSVVAHEVAHLVHFNHSPAFHALLAQLFDGDVEAPNRWLKQHGRALYAHFG
jgi:predicted metal-dependent hydrolase